MGKNVPVKEQKTKSSTQYMKKIIGKLLKTRTRII